MHALVCRAPFDLAVEERPDPGAPPPGWLRLAVGAVGICGTDFHIHAGKHPYLAYPRVPGHEVAGVVAAVGADVSLAVGARVIVNPYLSCGTCPACGRGRPNCCSRIEVLGVHRDGAFCEAILIPAANAYPAGDLALEAAAAVEYLAIGAHAVRRAAAPPGAAALVVGGGPIGLGTAFAARGAGQAVTIADLDGERLRFAADRLGFSVADGRDLGAALMGTPGGEGFDVVYDASGSTAAIRRSFDLVGHGGTLVLVSVVADDVVFSDPAFHKREMSLLGSRNATAEDFAAVTAAIRAGTIPVADLVTHRTDLAGAARHLPRWAADKAGLVKAVVHVGSDGWD